MMKAYKFYILTVLSLLAGACGDSKEEPVTVTPPQQVKVESTLNQRVDSTEPILFTASLDDDADTRAITSTYDSRIVYGLDYHDGEAHFHDGMEDQGDLEISGFGVYGFYTGHSLIADATDVTDVTEKEIVMLNQQVTYDRVNHKWIYSPMRFWPASTGTMSFFAYAPYSSTEHPSIGRDGVDYSKQVSGPMKDAYTYNEGISIILPTINWTLNSQQDVVWGMANESTTQDAFKLPHTLNGFPYKNIHRPSDGTLKWKFKHALARVKFSIANYKNIIESYDDVVPGIPIGTPSFIDEGDIPRYVGATGDKPMAVKYDKGTASDGWYAFLYEKDQALCHKIDNLSEKTRRVVITGVTLKNLVTGATFRLDNTHYLSQPIDNSSDDTWWNNDYAWEPWWENSIIGNLPLDTHLLNPKFYISQADINLYDGSLEPGHHSPEDLFKDDLFPDLGPTFMPLIDTGNPDKEHYFLMVPYKYDANGINNMEIEISYQVISRYKLTGNFTWSKEHRNAGTPPEPAPDPPSGPYTLDGISGINVDPFTVKSTIKTDFDANHSYHVIIHLGAMMELMFEVTDWDNNWANYNSTNPGQDEESKPIDTPITVTIPDYE